MTQKPRILFINPPIRLHIEEFEYLVHWPRHAIVLAAELQENYDVSILDVTAEFHADPQRFVPSNAVPSSTEEPALTQGLSEIVSNRINELSPDVVVVHAHAAPHVPIVKLTFDAIIEVLASNQSKPRVVIGGMAATHLTEEIAKWAPDGSWIVKGEGTGRICDIMDLVLQRRKPNLANEVMRDIESQRPPVRESLRHRNYEENIYLPQKTTKCTVLDINNRHLPIIDYPMPRFDLLRMDVYQRLFDAKAFVPHIEMSSGCTFKCNFCGVHYENEFTERGMFRRRPAEFVVDELKYLRDTFGFDEFYFCDETFTLAKRHTEELLQAIIQELPGIKWRCVTRVDEIDRETAELMHRAGCFEIGFGIEVGDEALLEDIAKETTVDLNASVIHMVQELGINANALTIIGMPQEDHKGIRRTFDFLARVANPHSSQIFVFHPVPGTEYYLHPQEHGLQFDTRDVEQWYKWDHIGEPVCDTEYLSREDIARYFMLFNRALPTIFDPTVDQELQDRIINNEFPVRRKGVTWILEPHRIQISRPIDPSRCIEDNILAVEFDPSQGEELGADYLKLIEFVISRCNGLLTEAEIAHEVYRLFDLSVDCATEKVRHLLKVLSNRDGENPNADFVAFF